MKKQTKKTAKIKKQVINVHKRPSWDEYFIEIMHTVANRATCDRGRSGCVIAKDKRLLTAGYVGSPVGCKDCDEIGHEIHTVTQEDGTISKHCIRTTHAEQNAIVQAAKIGISINGSTLYCKMTPCYVCAKMIINAGIVRVVAEMDYHGGARSKEVFKEAGVKFVLLNSKTETYANMK